jgi:ACS family glucarate transporter-like MFS transporter
MKYRYRVLGFLGVFAIITFVDRICISIAAKEIQADLGLSPSQWGWVLGSFVLAYAVFEIPTGAMGDRLGPRRVIARIVIWWSAFTALTGAAVGFWSLVLCRFLFGAGEAGAYPNCSAAVVRWFPKVERARAQGFIWMMSKLGAAVAPLLVIPLQHAFGWRVSFIVFGGAGVIWAGAWYWWFRDTPAEKPGVTEKERAELAGLEPPGTHGRLPWKKVMSRPNLWWIMAMYHTHCWSAFFFLTWLHTFLENGRGYTKTDLLQLSWIPFVCGACSNLLGGIVSDMLVKRVGLKWGRRVVGIVGHGVTTVFLAAALLTDDKLLTVVFLAVAYAGSDFMLPVAWAVCLDIGGKHAGAITGAMNTAGQAGSFLTTVIFGHLVSAYGSYDLPLVPIIGMSFLSTLVWLKIDPTLSLFDDPTGPRPSTGPARLDPPSVNATAGGAGA